MTDQVGDHLADVIRRYNTAPYGSGGKRTIGTLILQRGTKRIPLEHKRIPEEWPNFVLAGRMYCSSGTRLFQPNVQRAREF